MSSRSIHGSLAAVAALASGIILLATAALMPTVHSQTNAREAILQKALEKLTPEQEQMITPLTQRSVPEPGGEIRGFVTASLTDPPDLRTSALPHAQVFLQASNRPVDQQSIILTDSEGRFHIPLQKQGVYNVCASSAGFEKSCTSATVETHNVTILEPINIKPIGKVVRGCVSLKDGTPPASSYTSPTAAEVSIEGAGRTVAGPVPVNASGCYVIPVENASGNLEVVARYRETIERKPIQATELQHQAALDLVLPIAESTSADTKRRLPGFKKFPHTGTFIDPKPFMGCTDASTCSAEAQEYYHTIGVTDSKGNPTGSYTSFGTWKKDWGFTDDPTNPNPSEVRAVYYNNADLQFGRDMHCRGPLAGPGSTIVNVCYVANYSDSSCAPGGDPQKSVVNAELNKNPIAAVAMVEVTSRFAFPKAEPLTFESVPFVEFIVFTPSSPNSKCTDGIPIDAFVPNPEAILDSEGAKAVPGVCMACHGGTYNATKHNLSASGGMARFLPFDTPSFLYDDRLTSPSNPSPGPFSEVAQRESFRKLNIIAESASTQSISSFIIGANSTSLTSQTTLDLVDGWYSWCGGVGTANCYIDDVVPHLFVPNVPCASDPTMPPFTCGWSDWWVYAVTYQQVPRTVCRTCHVANSDRFNWQSRAYASTAPAPNSICSDVNSHIMPHAEVPYNRFWNSVPDQQTLSAFAHCGGLTPPN